MSDLPARERGVVARVVVIGAGVGGLAAGIRLAVLGHQVVVCESSAVAGGKLAGQSQRTDAGVFRHDTGPTLLTLPQVFADLFAHSGESLEQTLSLRRLDPIARYRFADGTTVDTTSDPGEQRRTFDEAFGRGAGAAWQGVIDRGDAIWRAVEGPLFGHAMTTRTMGGVAAALSLPSRMRAIAPGRTLRSLGHSLLSDPRQRMMLDRYATYEGSDPRRAPAALAVVPFLEHRFGAWYVDGGLHRLVDALVARLVDVGGELRLGATVEHVEVAGGRVDGVRLRGGETLPADVVVSNADAQMLYGTLAPRRRVPPADSFSGFVLLLALSTAHPQLARHTVMFGSEPYDAEFDALFATGPRCRPVADPVLYLHAPEDDAAAPPGRRAVYVLANAPRHAPDAMDWNASGVAERYADDMLQLLADRGLDLRPDILVRDIRTPATLERDTGAPGGSIYGQVQHGALATVRRRHNRSFTRGLFLVGGSTHPGGGLPLVAMSAAVVADTVGPA